MLGTAPGEMRKLFLLIVRSQTLLVGRQDAEAWEPVGTVAECTCLGAQDIFHPLLSVVWVPCSKIFSHVHFLAKLDIYYEITNLSKFQNEYFSLYLHNTKKLQQDIKITAQQ